MFSEHNVVMVYIHRCTTMLVINQYKWSMLPTSMVAILLTTSDHTQSTVYVTAIKLIATTGRLVEGEKGRTVTARTLAGGL